MCDEGVMLQHLFRERAPSGRNSFTCKIRKWSKKFRVAARKAIEALGSAARPTFTAFASARCFGPGNRSYLHEGVYLDPRAGRRTVVAAIAFASLTMFCLPPARAAALEQPKRILLINPSAHAQSPWINTAAAFRTELAKRSAEPIDVYELSFDAPRFEGQSSDEQSFVGYVHTLFRKKRIDLVVPFGAPAIKFLQRHRTLLFPTVPMLGVGSAPRRIPRNSLGDKDVLVETKTDLDSFIRNIITVRPQTEHVFVVSGSSPVEQYWTVQLREAAKKYSNRLTFDWSDTLSFDEILARVSNLPQNWAVFDLGFSTDVRGVSYSQDSALDALRAVISVPIFGNGDYQLGRGIVGGPLGQTHRQAEKAAAIAVRLLNGESPGNIRSTPVVFETAYDWKELQTWGISEALLPSGSTVLFRQPNVFIKYRSQILAIAAVLLAQAFFIFLLLREHHRRGRAEEDVRKRVAELDRMNRKLVASELSASIAHEIKQPLAAIVSNGGAAARWLAAKPPELQEANSCLENIIKDGYRTSQIVDNLHMVAKRGRAERVAVEPGQIVREVLDLLRDQLTRHHVQVSTSIDRNLPRAILDRILVQQVLINLVSNAVEAMEGVSPTDRRLQIVISAADEESIAIKVKDSGSGIKPEDIGQIFRPFFSTKSDGMGIGLSICRSIVESHGGRLTVDTRFGHGSVFRIVLPITTLEGKADDVRSFQPSFARLGDRRRQISA